MIIIQPADQGAYWRAQFDDLSEYVGIGITPDVAVIDLMAHEVKVDLHLFERMCLYKKTSHVFGWQYFESWLDLRLRFESVLGVR